MYIPVDLPWIQAVMLASVRVIAFVVIAPPFSHKSFPGRVKAVIAIGLALAAAPRVTSGFEELGDVAFLGSLIAEFAVGACLGFIVYVLFAAVQDAGGLIDTFGGFQIAQGFDPQLNIHGAQFSRLFGMAAIALTFSTGAYQVIIGGLMSTFESVPLGAGFDDLNIETVVAAVSGVLVAAVQIAGPLLIVLFLADIGLGLLTRVAPALNAFALGFPLKILLTLTLGVLIFVALPATIASLTGDAIHAIQGVTGG
ncbi:flagellar biosynthetic protein FliR [Agromyces humi]|uniref:flagellar biosynthetic protein FliR n=1 Tax=Agromyces humi TaxID=1766800 RepID=UPI001359100C|nr:flagellar biosynthetic protein FliR [Agromyces humi]